MAGMDLPVRAIREQVSSAIDLVIHQERLRDGTRKVVNITEVSGMEGDVVTISINIRGREWTKDDKTVYFNTITGWKVEKLQEAAIPEMPPVVDDDRLPF